jgi:hypothetical protein
MKDNSDLARGRNALFGKPENLVSFIQELDADWTPNWDDEKEEKYYLRVLPEIPAVFITADRIRPAFGLTYMSLDTAKKVKEIIDNSFKKNKKG